MGTASSIVSRQPRRTCSAERGTPPLLIVGGSGHAAVVADMVRAACEYALAGCTTLPGDEPPPGVPWLGGDDRWHAIRASGVAHAFVAIGDATIRTRLAEALIVCGFTLVSIVDPSAAVSPSARVGAGVAIMPRVAVNARTTIGDLAILNTGCIVEHDATIGRAAHIAPGATLAGRIVIGDRAVVGPGATVAAGVAIGAGAIIGAGSVVLRDVAQGARAWGVPARVR